MKCSLWGYQKPLGGFEFTYNFFQSLTLWTYIGLLGRSLTHRAFLLQTDLSSTNIFGDFGENLAKNDNLHHNLTKHFTIRISELFFRRVEISTKSRSH